MNTELKMTAIYGAERVEVRLPTDGTILIGADPYADLILDGPGVQPGHMVLSPIDGGLEILRPHEAPFIVNGLRRRAHRFTRRATVQVSRWTVHLELVPVEAPPRRPWNGGRPAPPPSPRPGIRVVGALRRGPRPAASVRSPRPVAPPVARAPSAQRPRALVGPPPAPPRALPVAPPPLPVVRLSADDATARTTLRGMPRPQLARHGAQGWGTAWVTQRRSPR